MALWFQKWHEELGELSLKRSKVIMGPYVSATKFQRNYVSWHWRKMQNLKENWLLAWKKTKGIWLIFVRGVESLKIHTMMGFYCPKHSYRWKITEELSIMTLKSNAKFEKKLTFGFKNNMRNLVNFNASSNKSENLHFDVLLFQ